MLIRVLSQSSDPGRLISRIFLSTPFSFRNFSQEISVARGDSSPDYDYEQRIRPGALCSVSPADVCTSIVTAVGHSQLDK